MNSLNYIDVFAGGGGLSEGFHKQGFTPIAHVEFDKAACYTLRTRACYHYLKKTGKDEIYHSYLKGEISRSEMYNSVPAEILDSVINAEIGPENKEIFSKIDTLRKGKEVDLIIGGPPCQAYSSLGRGALKHKQDDPRKKLYIQYGRFLKKYNPKIFIFENVKGLLNSENGKHFKNLQKYYKSLGYTVEAKVLNAIDYGVIQQRERIIIIGWRKNLNLIYPEIKTVENKFSTKDIFDDLPIISHGENRKALSYRKKPSEYLQNNSIVNGQKFVSQHVTRPHNQKDLNIYKLAISEFKKGIRLKNNAIPENMRTQKNTKDFLDRFKVVGDIPHTMIAHIAKDGHHFIHPDENQLRSISVREAARIQSFPDSYFFEGITERSYRSAAFRQIGNAVPPLMAERIAEQIRVLLNEK